MNKNEILYNRMMKKMLKDIKKIDNEFTQAELDLIKYGKCSYGAFLWQEELLYEIKIYITYFGFIDSLLFSEIKEMDWDKKFENYADYKEAEKKYNYYLAKRNGLIKLIKSKTKIISQFSFIENILKNIPAFEEFNQLYEDVKLHSYQLNLQQEFINAYNNGFMQWGHVRYDYITKQFEKYCNEIDEYKKCNKSKIAQIRLIK